MPDARFRRRADEWQYGVTCIDCGGPKAENATRCRPCWTETLRANPAYWASRTCPNCGGEKYRQSARCRPCTNLAMVGKPRVGPVIVSADHKWRKLRIGKAAA